MKKILLLALGIGFVVIVGALIFFSLGREEVVPTDQPVTVVQSSVGSTELVVWEPINGAWKPTSTPPACPEPLQFQMPVDVDVVTSVLYPGQFRPDYKPHGGFRFDHSESGEIPVYAPFEGYVLKGGRYFASGEIQYVFFIMHPCGIMYRLGHLKELSPKLLALAETLPEPKELDSRDYIVEHIPIKQGELLATEVGVTGNYFFDWGVYDLRKKNKASEDPAWLAEHSNDQAPYAICWLDFLSPEASARVKALPGADGTSGTESDYCD